MSPPIDDRDFERHTNHRYRSSSLSQSKDDKLDYRESIRQDHSEHDWRDEQFYRNKNNERYTIEASKKNEHYDRGYRYRDSERYYDRNRSENHEKRQYYDEKEDSYSRRERRRRERSRSRSYSPKNDRQQNDSNYRFSESVRNKHSKSQIPVSLEDFLNDAPGIDFNFHNPSSESAAYDDTLLGRKDQKNHPLCPESDKQEMTRIIRSIYEQSTTDIDFEHRMNLIRKFAELADRGDGIRNLEREITDQWLRKKVRHLLRAMGLKEGFCQSQGSTKDSNSSSNRHSFQKNSSNQKESLVWRFEHKDVVGAVDVLDEVMNLFDSQKPQSHASVTRGTQRPAIGPMLPGRDAKVAEERRSTWMEDADGVASLFGGGTNNNMKRQQDAASEEEQKQLREQIENFRRSHGESKSLFELTRDGGKYNPNQLRRAAEEAKRKVEESAGVWGGGRSGRKDKAEGLRSFEKEFAVTNKTGLDAYVNGGKFDSKFTSHISKNVT